MKVLVISSRDLEKGSTKYRIVQFEDYFSTQGVQLEYVKRKDIDSNIIRSLDKFDLVYNQKCLLNSSVSKKIIKNSRRVFFDFDDAIYTRPGRPHSWLTDRRVKRRLQFWLQHADCVTTANEVLADYARQYSSAVVVVPMALDLHLWASTEHRSSAITIGWAGAPVNIPLIEQLDGVLSQLLEKYPAVKLAIFSGKRPRLSCDFDYYSFASGKEAEFIKKLDIGLLPLVGDEYSRGKSPIKAIQYIACGIPVVGNIAGATTEILNDSNSIAVTSPEDWINALGQLIESPPMARSLGGAGRNHALVQHDSTKIRDQVLDLMRV